LCMRGVSSTACPEKLLSQSWERGEETALGEFSRCELGQLARPPSTQETSGVTSDP